jgi:hypothetical protein
VYVHEFGFGFSFRWKVWAFCDLKIVKDVEVNLYFTINSNIAKFPILTATYLLFFYFPNMNMDSSIYTATERSCGKCGDTTTFGIPGAGLAADARLRHRAVVGKMTTFDL